MNQAIQDDAVLTEPEARQLLRLSKITLLRMRQLDDRGGLPFVQLSPGRIGYFRRDVLAYLAARRVGRLPNEQRGSDEPHRLVGDDEVH
jgi:hypothetical protein